MYNSISDIVGGGMMNIYQNGTFVGIPMGTISRTIFEIVNNYYDWMEKKKMVEENLTPLFE